MCGQQRGVETVGWESERERDRQREGEGVCVCVCVEGLRASGLRLAPDRQASGGERRRLGETPATPHSD